MKTIKDKLNEMLLNKEMALLGFNVQLNLLEGSIDELEDKELELLFNNLKDKVDERCYELVHREV